MDRSGRSGNNDNWSTGHPDLAAALAAMRLGNPSPRTREQQQEQAPQRQQSAWLLQRRMMSMEAGLQVARQSWLQQSPQQAYQGEEMGSSSGGGGGGYFSPIGAAAAASNPSALYDNALYDNAWYGNSAGRTYFSAQGQSGSQHHFVAASGPSWAQQPYVLSASANQYQPVNSPVAASSSNTSLQHLYQQQYAISNQSGADGYAWAVPDDDRNQVDLRLRAIRAAQAQAGHRAAPAAQPRGARTPEETRSRLLRAPIDLHVVTFPQSPKHVVELLQEGDDKIRLNVLAGVTRRIHDFMGSSDGHKVFVELLVACAGRDGEVKAIVEAALHCRPKLLPLMKHDHGASCLEQLMAAAAPDSNLCAMLLDRFLYEGVLLDGKGDRVLNCCFDTMRYEDTKVILHAALDGDMMDAMAYSRSPAGSKCLVECFNNARGNEFRRLQDAVIDKAYDLAMGEYSNYFVQHALEHTDVQTRQILVQRLMPHVVTLSLHRTGSYVVEACFQKAQQVDQVLHEFLIMGDDQLVELVQGNYSNYVVHRLLDAAKEGYPKETLGLARRIYRLQGARVWQMFTDKVMRVVCKILARKSRFGPSYR
ncbi:Pumilio domain-containing protein [Hordeum vulgare]|nr:Pumilio domain-containing protein [Hordeum vulgare]